MENFFGLFLPIAVVFGVLLFLYTFRSGLTDVVYLALTHWKHTAFVVICITVGVLVGAYNSHLGSLENLYNLRLSILTHQKNDDEQMLATINACKKFVEARLDGKPAFDEPSPRLNDVIRIGAQSYWDTCANAFGMNYWKHDIFIRGEEGGPALCRAYRKDDYRSGTVESWCASVLAPARKI